MSKTTVIRVAKLAGTWIPALFLVIVFARQGWAKFDDGSGWARAFRAWGYPDWFRVTIGVLEVGAAALLVAGRTAAFGAMIIMAVMLGGMGTHVVLEGGRHVTSEVVPLTLATIVLVIRRRQLRPVLARLKRGADSTT